MRSQPALAASLASVPREPGRGRGRGCGNTVSIRNSMRAPGAVRVRSAQQMISRTSAAWPDESVAVILQAAARCGSAPAATRTDRFLSAWSLVAAYPSGRPHAPQRCWSLPGPRPGFFCPEAPKGLLALATQTGPADGEDVLVSGIGPALRGLAQRLGGTHLGVLAI